MSGRSALPLRGKLLFALRFLVITYLCLTLLSCLRVNDDVIQSCVCLSPDGVAPRVARERGEFGLLTYNVAGLPHLISAARPDHHSALISPLLNRYELVLLQEDFSYNEALFSASTHPFRTAAHPRGFAPFSDGLSRLSRFEMKTVRRVRWDEANGIISGQCDELAEKGFSMARTEIAPGHSVDVYNLHADAGEGFADDRARAAGLRQLARFIREQSVSHPVIVAGDFNLNWIRDRDRRHLEDLMATTGLRDAGKEARGDRTSIDRVLFRGCPKLELAVAAYGADPSFHAPCGAPLSDHPAIHVRFAWQEPRAGSALPLHEDPRPIFTREP